MSAPNIYRQKKARSTLDQLFNDSSNVWVTHYSCESFYDTTEGASARITSIALRRLHSAQTISFSIHQKAEIEGVEPDQITNHYDNLEKKMLDDYFEHISNHRGMHYLHWNMRDINYGFAAIEHRYRVLKGDPYIIEEEAKHDLARLLIDIYGTGYTGHPRLPTLIEKNHIVPRDFMTGKAEAEAFTNGDYVGLHQSTLRKVDVIANLAGRAHDRHLKVNTSWWEMNGGRIRGIVNWVIETTWMKVLLTLGGLLGLGTLIFSLF